MNMPTDKLKNLAAAVPINSPSEMSLWFESDLGKTVLQAQCGLLNTLLPRHFGYHLLQLGCANNTMYNSSPIGHKVSICADGSVGKEGIVAQSEALPFANESIDLVLIHHGLDMSAGKHQLLREVSRVLIAGGHVIILGFNPYSCWGLRNKFSRNSTFPWNTKLLTPSRVMDWLQLLEFQIQRVDYMLYSMPVNSPRIIKYSSFFDDFASRINWPTGGVYAISAKKEVLPLTPIKDPWGELTKARVGLPLADRIPRPSYECEKKKSPN